MKIRKLIFSAKLEQIEKQNQNIFIFHCSANASQWRFLKNFLFFYERALANKTTSELRALEGATKELFPVVGARNNGHFYPARSTDCPKKALTEPFGRRLTVPEAPQLAAEARFGAALRRERSLLRGTYFQSTSFKKNPDPAFFRPLPRPVSGRRASRMRGCDSEAASAAPVFATKKANPLAGPKMSRKARMLPRLYAPAAKIAGGSRASVGAAKHPGSHTALSQKSLNKKFRPKGCLFFFDTRSNTLFETHQKKPVNPLPRSGLELVNKTLRALEFNNNLILLYGQMNSTVVNHVDIKETLILDAQTTYQQLFLSMHSLSIGLNFCLHQKIDEFFCVQETTPRSAPNAGG